MRRPVDDLKIRQKCEEMIAYGYVALRQFPTFERHVLAAEKPRQAGSAESGD